MRVSAVLGLILLLQPAYIRLSAQSPVSPTDETETFRRATETNRPVLLVFSGSDWCIPCIKFRRKILFDESFIDFAKQEVVLLEADFPQRTTLSKELVERNERLAERYNPDGLFPHVLLLRPDRSVIAPLAYENRTASEFIHDIKAYLPSVQHVADERMGEPGEFSISARLMGCGFEFTVIDTDPEHARRVLQASIDEVKRIEYFLSEWIDTTQTSRINQAAGRKPVKVGCELYDLLQRSIDISRLTQGAFDVSFNGVGHLWKFDGSQTTLPDSADVRKAISTIGFEKIRLLDSCTVFLPVAGMKLGFGGIGQGYAADRVKDLLEREGIKSAVVNASGDLIAWGKRPDGTPWKIGISDPANPSNILLWVPVENAAVVTSGSYEKFFEVDGVRYAHIIDPRTGYPTRGIKSVTVISPSAEFADALATAVFVLGTEVGLDLIEQLPDTECIIIDDKNVVHHSKDLKLL